MAWRRGRWRFPIPRTGCGIKGLFEPCDVGALLRPPPSGSTLSGSRRASGPLTRRLIRCLTAG